MITRCRACGFRHEALDRCEVARRKREAASNGASNAMPTKLVEALVENAKLYSGHDPLVKAMMAEAPHRKAKKQRWDREKYNKNAAAYMREYRKRGKVAA